MQPNIATCTVIKEIDLATAEREDHRVVSVGFKQLVARICDGVENNNSAIARTHVAVMYEEWSLRVPWRRQLFQVLMADHHPGSIAAQKRGNYRSVIDAVQHERIESVKAAADVAFVRQAKPTHKPWFSSQT